MSRRGSIEPGYVMDIRVLETTDDLDDGVDLANMAEKLVAEAFALACSFTRPAISTNSMAAGIILWDFESAASLFQTLVRAR